MPRVEVGEVVRGAAVATARTSGGNRWLWPVIGVAAVALVWFFVTRGRAPSVSSTIGAGAAAVDSAAIRAGTVVQAAAGEVKGAIGGLGALVKRALPGGVTLDVPEFGIESKLIAFIEDKSRPVNDTTWFDFDRLNFATGAATILPESQEQLNNIVAMLKAYPNVNVKVGGYTDNVGDVAANLQLSQRRADAVMQALVSNGIPANRLRAEGYGEQHPVADNTTEEGRARNRRIALKVTKK
jgi:outer membrane protein OmpA-like peptidoglycan-associated protein